MNIIVTSSNIFRVSVILLFFSSANLMANEGPLYFNNKNLDHSFFKKIHRQFIHQFQTKYGFPKTALHPSNLMEICDNGIDDDGDGLIDCFDSDCFGQAVCDDFYYTGGGGDPCQYIPPTAATFELELVFQTDHTTHPIDQRCGSYVGDMDGDGIPEIVGKDPNPARIQIFSGIDGSIKQSITCQGNHAFSQLAIGDVDKDGSGDLFMMTTSNQLARYEFGNATHVWLTANNIGDNSSHSSPQITDFNEDGIPEVYVGNRIFNSITGTRLAIGSGNRGQPSSNGDKYPIAYNVFDSGDPKPGGGTFGSEADGLELIAGNQVYTVELGNGTQDNGTLTVVSTLIGNNIGDGFTSIADIDGDMEVDIVVLDGGRIYAWNPRNQTQIGSLYDIPSTSIGGRVNIGDFDNDGMVEIGTAGTNRYVVLEYNPGPNTFSVKWQKTGLDDGSQRTGSTLFDFEGDGINEVVYSEEASLYIWSGMDGSELIVIPSESGTRTEYPLVADVNADGAAEIIITAQNGNGPGFSGSGYIQVYRSKNTPWVAARPVWNQHGYFNVNVNDDLTIPTVQQDPLNTSFNNAFNGFLVQSTLLVDGGTPAFGAADATMSIDAVSNLQCPDILGLTLTVENIGDAELPGATPIAFYNGDPTSSTPTLLGETTIGTDINPGESSTFNFNLDISPNPTPIDLFGVVNDSGFLTVNLPYDLENDFPVTGTGECDFTNNISSFSNIECVEICGDGNDNDGNGLIDEPNITASQTSGCSGSNLNQMTTDVAGGIWSIISSIGSSIDQNGNVTLGINLSATPDEDTIIYNALPCPDTLFVYTFDNEAPATTCPSTQNLNANTICQVILPDYSGNLTLSDNCDANNAINITQMPTAGTILTFGITNITLTATDQSGNSNACSFDVNVSDDVNPTISCGGDDQTLLADPNNCALSLPDYSNIAFIEDNCTDPNNISITQNPPVGTSLSIEDNSQIVTLTADDGNGNTSQCTLNVVFAESNDPTISCPSDLTINADMNCEISLPDYTSAATVNDICTAMNDIIITQSPAANTMYTETTTPQTITLTADDGNGNTSQCTFEVTLSGLKSLDISCPTDKTIVAPNTCATVLPDYLSDATLMTNCIDQNNVSITQSPISGSLISGNGIIQEIIFTADDGNGNVANCSFNLYLNP